MSEHDRLHSAVDVVRMRQAKVAVVGTGASGPKCENLVRTGLGAIELFDKDIVQPENIGRQGFSRHDIGMRKVDAVAAKLKAIDPGLAVGRHHGDFLALTDEEIRTRFSDVDLWIAATDHFPAQARTNEIALMTGTPVIWAGVSRGAMWGEVVFWTPQHDSCCRCLTIGRYRAHQNAAQRGATIDPPSDGVTLADIMIVDSIAVQVAIGILTQGANNRFGQLIGALGDRTYLQIALRPEHPAVRRVLEVPDGNDACFAWCTAARRDPSPEPCPDCERFRGHRFVKDAKTGAYRRESSVQTAEIVELVI